MSASLKDLDPLDKLEMAIECMEYNVPFPGVIQDFLLEHSIIDIVTRKLHNVKLNR